MISHKFHYVIMIDLIFTSAEVKLSFFTVMRLFRGLTFTIATTRTQHH